MSATHQTSATLLSPPKTRPAHPVELLPFGGAVPLGLNALIHAWSRPEAHIPLACETPFLSRRDARTSRALVRRSGVFVAHAALHLRNWRSQGRALRIGIIGGVATAPEVRGQGLASAMLIRLEQEARAKGVEVLVLWDETEGSLYTRAGYERSGRELLMAVDAARESALADTRPRLGRVRLARSPSDAAAIAALHRTLRYGLTRERDDYARLFRMPRTDYYVLERAGCVRAYAVVGKGLDLRGCLHEWVADPEELQALVGGIARRRSEAQFWLMAPPWRVDLLEHWPQHGFGALGMVKILDSRAPGSPFAGDTLREALGYEDDPPQIESGLWMSGLDSM